jgi:hypothetical protein
MIVDKSGKFGIVSPIAAVRIPRVRTVTYVWKRMLTFGTSWLQICQFVSGLLAGPTAAAALR